MSEHTEKLANARLSQPLHELLRKRNIAARKSIWTQEDIDYAKAAAKVLIEKMGCRVNPQAGEVK